MDEGFLGGWIRPKLRQVMENSQRRESKSLQIRQFQPDDLFAIQTIRKRAFQPIFEESFLNIVGEKIFELQYSDWDEKQAEYLDSICRPDSGREVYVLLRDEDTIVGFIGLSMDRENAKGEIDLNAIDPDHQGKGAGQFMYDFALSRMRDEGIKLVQVSTGGDQSHAPARKAYEKAGFKVSIPSVTMFKMIS